MQSSFNKNTAIKITYETLMHVLDYSTDEIYILDKNHRIVYVNKVCERHYGVKPSMIIGKYNEEMFNKGYWSPMLTPIVFKEKEAVYMIQDTYLGSQIMTSAIPILDDNQEIEYVIFTSQEIQQTGYVEATSHSFEKEELEISGIQSQFITESPKMKEIISLLQKIAPVKSTVLIKGDTGTGKSLLTNYIHQLSQRTGSLIAINCAAIPEELLESELFGYAPGAFTGAREGGKKGLIELANEGTLFLDEISDMPLTLQAKMLHVIQNKEFRPLGGSQSMEVDIRIVAATNQSLEEMVKQKKFREDLYYRLNVIDITIPSLNQRKEDLQPLINHFLAKFNTMHHLNKKITNDCLLFLTSYDWPGNVRQLENVMEKLVVTSKDIIEVADIPDLIKKNSQLKHTLPSNKNLDSAVNNLTRNIVRESYLKNKSSRKVAEDLNISQSRASNLIREHCQDLRE